MINNMITYDFDDAVSYFENYMKNLYLVVCKQCNRQTDSYDVIRRDSICGTCSRAKGKYQFAGHRVNLGQIPSELKGLTLIEQLLIARVQPILTICDVRIPSKELILTNMFRIDESGSRVAKKLPNMDALKSIIILRSKVGSTRKLQYEQFRARSKVIIEALEWLRANNLEYNDIIIDKQFTMNYFPENDYISDMFPNTIESKLLINNYMPLKCGCFPYIPKIEMVDQMDNNPNQVKLLNKLIDQFECYRNCLCLAFPALFPYGRNLLKYDNFNYREYFKYLLRYHDSRFAKSERFIHFAYQYIAQINIINLAINHRNTSYQYYPLRGSDIYWQERRNELSHMICQLGNPTIFFTLTAADFHWPDLFRVLTSRSDVEISELTDFDRAKLLQEKPILVAWFFQKRIEIFMKKFVIPIFNVRNYWYRFDWQNRGTPHIHGLLWLNDAPHYGFADIGSLSEQQRGKLVKYYDNLVSASMEIELERFKVYYDDPIHPSRQRYTELSLEQKEADLNRLLNRLNRHTWCNNYCLRRIERGISGRCRFRYPARMDFKSSMKQFRRHYWKFIPKRNDPYLNTYNKFLTQAWRASADFSPIIPGDELTNLINYMTKPPSSDGKGNIMQQIMAFNWQNTSRTSVLGQLEEMFDATSAERIVPTLELAHFLLGYPLYHASRSFTRVSLERTDLDENKLVEWYANRPYYYDRLSLFEFAMCYNYNERKASFTKKKQTIVVTKPILYLPNVNINHDENHYKYKCKLFIPWRFDFEQNFGRIIKWSTLYKSYKSNIY